MKPFIEVAIPHRDILEGRFTLETYAADLWEVYKGSAPVDYCDADTFFSKTFETKGLEEIVNIAERKLQGQPSDSVIQLQTPFGGGKTHTLIYLYHKAKKQDYNVVVFSGDKFGSKDNTLWEEMEKQLTGKIELFKGKNPPGGDSLKKFLQKHEPLIILMDEVHAYLVGISAEKVGESSLSTLTLVFIQNLTNTIKTMSRSIMFLSIPLSNPYNDESSERTLASLKNIVSRVERVFTPINDEEISDVVKRRLFQKINNDEAKRTITEFLDYAQRENLLPEGVDKAVYKERFLRSYPFQPEVIDVLYKRWGSIPQFQRTRGVLRLLALVVHSLMSSRKPYIRLADFNIGNEEIRRELIKYIGQEYDSIIAQDITGSNSGAKKVDALLGDAYRAYCFGTSCATTIFMYSFSGGPDRGATLSDVKLSSAEFDVSSGIVVDAVNKLREHLFYLSDTALVFTNKPNLNKILIDRMESIGDDEVENAEKEYLKSRLGDEFKNYIWPKHSRDIPDIQDLKLVIMRNGNNLEEFVETCGERPRVYRNTLLFLCPDMSQRANFERELKRKLAWERIEKDSHLPLAEAERREIKEKIKKSEQKIIDGLRNLYRIIKIPSKGELKEINLGIGITGSEKKLDREVFDRLRDEGEIVPKISPKVLIDKYLRENWVETKKIYEALLKTPGEMRIPNEEVLKTAIKQGVREGLFGLGILENNTVKCLYFKEECAPELSDVEILIKKEISERVFDIGEGAKEKTKGEITGKTDDFTIKETLPTQFDLFSKIKLEVRIPGGKLSDFTNTLRYINSKFDYVSLKIYLEAMEGNISKSDYEDKIKEAFTQSGIIIENEEIE
ncbi:MAG: DUF499 domain-containing protein [Thermodesulfovibrio sp.]|nr:DUF499 domain-containing protein [Thermodesulfovibrio sp.]